MNFLMNFGIVCYARDCYFIDMMDMLRHVTTIAITAEQPSMFDQRQFFYTFYN